MLAECRRVRQTAALTRPFKNSLLLFEGTKEQTNEQVNRKKKCLAPPLLPIKNRSKSIISYNSSKNSKLTRTAAIHYCYKMPQQKLFNLISNIYDFYYVMGDYSNRGELAVYMTGGRGGGPTELQIENPPKIHHRSWNFTPKKIQDLNTPKLIFTK